MFRAQNRETINGVTDPTTIAEHFATHFSKACTTHKQGLID